MQAFVITKQQTLSTSLDVMVITFLIMHMLSIMNIINIFCLTTRKQICKAVGKCFLLTNSDITLQWWRNVYLIWLVWLLLPGKMKSYYVTNYIACIYNMRTPVLFDNKKLIDRWKYFIPFHHILNPNVTSILVTRKENDQSEKFINLPYVDKVL